MYPRVISLSTHLLWRIAPWIVAAILLTGCTTTRRSPYDRYYGQTYRAPGSASDPWGPYIQQASARFSVPDSWIRAVIQQESGGHEYLDGQPITSSAGAMGLMQLMPETYAEMQSQFGLGSDPYEPHDNIMAGTGYIRILYRKYGAPAFLAAYNAGPQRLEDYLYNGRELPNETVNYVASVTPNLGTQIALSGPLAAYAAPGQSTTGAQIEQAPVEVAEAPANEPVQMAYMPTPAHCDPNAAYDPGQPCQPLAAPSPTDETQQTASSLPPPSPTICDPNAAYDDQPSCTPSKNPTPASFPTPPPAAPHIAAAAYMQPVDTNYGAYAVQVGAFSGSGQARFAATMARQADYRTLSGAQIVLQPTPALGRGTFWRARLAGLSRKSAASACANLQSRGMACLLVPPGH
ncbi:transglycosylase SLT domain-containing protein [Kozakia baliensis]|uniref:transglycosylase SLT domain-containing protein n=1 Tax=Kozakia baliensis TaxID=153496 RepID=UPI0009DEC9AE|nr:transglycosylase SLT domain-containing protein [Kozakia baliensis]